MSSVPSSTLSLYRALLRQGQKMNNYNFKSYALRRTRDGFKADKNLTGEEAEMARQYAVEQLQVLSRQAIIGNLYPSDHSVMDTTISSSKISH
jgi:DNA-binding response OmpR family regulator